VSATAIINQAVVSGVYIFDKSQRGFIDADTPDSAGTRKNT
jgi:hypothetical protein